MAYYEHLPMYQKALALCVYLEKVVYHFSRYHKYNAGADLRKLSRLNVRLIIRANSQLKRIETLWELRENIEELKICMRICKEVGAFRNLNFNDGNSNYDDVSSTNYVWPVVYSDNNYLSKVE